MRDGQTSLDVVVRSEDGLSLTLVASEMPAEGLTLVGTLLDPGFPGRIDTEIRAVISQELIAGAHIERSTDLIVAVNSEERTLNWQVETTDLGDGFVLHDARVTGDEGPLRAFAIEDLLATAGAGLAVAVVGVIAWRSYRREERARADADKKWQQCLEAGGSPEWRFRSGDRVGVDHRGPNVSSDYDVAVFCDMSRAEPSNK